MASKYHAVRTTIDGITFASKAEARRYAELKMLEKAGEIKGLELQPRFRLMAPELGSGFDLHIGDYVADFRYQRITVIGASDRQGFYHTGNGSRPYGMAATTPGIDIKHDDVIEDVKGVKTALYLWKKKHVEAQYGITITEVA